MGLSGSFALPVGRGSRRAVTSFSLSSIWLISRYHLSRRKALHPSRLPRIPDLAFFPIPHSAFRIPHLYRLNMRPPSSHSPGEAPNPPWAIWRKKVKKVAVDGGL